MATYFFHWRCGDDRIDDGEGRDAPDLPAAVVIAVHELRGLVSQDALDGRIRMAQRIDIEDVGRRVVHRLAVRDAITFV